MRLAILGDTHEQHRDVDLPEVDLLIHAGDWTFFSKRMKAVEDFNDWLSSLSDMGLLWFREIMSFIWRPIRRVVH